MTNQRAFQKKGINELHETWGAARALFSERELRCPPLYSMIPLVRDYIISVDRDLMPRTEAAQIKKIMASIEKLKPHIQEHFFPELVDLSAKVRFATDSKFAGVKARVELLGLLCLWFEEAGLPVIRDDDFGGKGQGKVQEVILKIADDCDWCIENDPQAAPQRQRKARARRGQPKETRYQELRRARMTIQESL